jgi:hypothetical protein
MRQANPSFPASGGTASGSYLKARDFFESLQGAVSAYGVVMLVTACAAVTMRIP